MDVEPGRLSLSVAMATYNGAEHLLEQLQSIVDQTRPVAEIVIVDDGSTDGTVTLVREFAATSPVAVYLHVSDANQGSTRAFERALGLVSGDVVALCDQDDVWYPHKSTTLLAAFEADDRVGAAFSDLDLVDERLRPLGQTAWASAQVALTGSDLAELATDRAMVRLLQRPLVTGAALAVRSSLLPVVLPFPAVVTGGIRGDMIHDGWIATIVAGVSGIQALPEPLVAYRQHAGQQIGLLAGESEREHLDRSQEYGDWARRLAPVVERLQAMYVDFPPHSGLVEPLVEQLGHIRARAALPVRRRSRILPVLAEVRTGRYHRLSAGWRSVVADLGRHVQPAAGSRLLVAARPFDLSDAPFDAFVQRRLGLVAALRDEFEVGLVLLRPDTDVAAPAAALRDLPCTEISLPHLDTGRGARLARAARSRLPLRRPAWQRQLALAAVGFDIALTCGPWLDSEYGALHRSLPSVYLLEEDLERVPELHPQSSLARKLRRALVHLRPSVERPREVVVIAGPEVAHARMRVPGVPVTVLPLTLDPAKWKVCEDAADEPGGEYVLVVGALHEQRNVVGLVDVLERLSARGRHDVVVRLVSGRGLATEIEDLLGPSVLSEPPADDLGELYRRARLVLVPALAPTGMKTTILQGWASGVAVVSYTESAATVGVTSGGGAVLFADDAAGVADWLLAAWDDAGLRARTATAGKDQLLANHDPGDVQQHLCRLLQRAGEPARQVRP